MILPFALARKLLALADSAFRQGTLLETLVDLDERSLSMYLSHLAGAIQEAGHRALWRELVLALLTPGVLDAERRAGVLDRLTDDPRRAVFEFLAVDPADRRAGGGRTFTAYAYDDLPLGIRKARARQRTGESLRILCEDPDPSVIRILLENPTLVESHALKVASRRPQAPAVFVEVLASVRFGVRETVQASLVLNPWCPVQLALATLPLLGRPRLQEVGASRSLDVRVRAAADVHVATHQA